MKKNKLLLLVIAGATILGFMNCSPNIDLTAPRAGSLGGFGRPDYSKVLTAYQDQTFEFQIPGYPTSGAAIAITNKPAWLNADTATGRLFGVPTESQNLQGIAVRVTMGTASIGVGSLSITVIADPLKTHQWHLKNTGQSTFAGLGGRADEDIHLSQTVAAKILGQGIRIAVSDSGIQETHRGLSPNLLTNQSRNYFNNFAATNSWLGNSTPDLAKPDLAHGTGVAGLIAEKGWTGLGGRGVAPEAKIAGFLYLPAQSTLASRGLSSVARLDQYAGDFDIYNYSWGPSQCALIRNTQAEKDKIQAGAQTGRGGKGAIFVKAAGNSYTEDLSTCVANAPAQAYVLGNANSAEEQATPFLINVAAVNAEGLSASYSTPGANIWIAAPGGEVGLQRQPTGTTSATLLKPAMLTTDFAGCMSGLKTFGSLYSDFNSGKDPNTNCEHLATMNGTSSASPVAAGAIALILSANPNLTWRDVKHIVAATADQVDASRGPTNHPAGDNLAGHTYQSGWTTNAAGFKFHNWYGFGRINVDKAVAMAKTYNLNFGTFKETRTGAAWKYDSGPLNIAVPQSLAAGISRTIDVTEQWTIEAVQIKLSATACIGNLGVELTSPSGTKSILLNINSYLLDPQIAGQVFLSNAFYGESSVGTWTLKLIGAKACTTTWNSWGLNIIGR